MYIICVSNRIDSINRGGTVESQNTGASLPEAVPIKPKSFFSRLLGTVVSPGETFRDIGRSPTMLVPIIALIIFGTLQGFYLSTHFDMESILSGMSSAQGQAQTQMTPEQKERMEQQMAFIAKFIKVFIIVSSGIMSVIFALAVAGVFKLISKIVGAESGFKALFCVTAYVMLSVSIISFALLVLIASFKDPSELTYANMRNLVCSNLGAILGSFFGEDILPKFLMKLTQYADAFAIWMIALMSIGYSTVSRKLKAGTVAIWFIALYGILALIGATVGTIFSPS
jgi:hypothetical protein